MIIFVQRRKKNSDVLIAFIFYLEKKKRISLSVHIQRYHLLLSWNSSNYLTQIYSISLFWHVLFVVCIFEKRRFVFSCSRDTQNHNNLKVEIDLRCANEEDSNWDKEDDDYIPSVDVKNMVKEILQETRNLSIYLCQNIHTYILLSISAYSYLSIYLSIWYFPICFL